MGLKICLTCGLEMKCIKTGGGVNFGNGHVYASDWYRCSHCGCEVAVTAHEAIHDPEHKYHPVFRNMAGVE